MVVDDLPQHDPPQGPHRDETTGPDPTAATAQADQTAPVPEEQAGNLAASQGAVHAIPQRLEQIAEQLSALETEMVGLRTIAEDIGRQQQVQPAQMRRLIAKVDDMTTSLTDARLRSVFQSLLLVHDLLENMQSSALESGDDEHARRYGAVLTQIIQIFSNNGLSAVPDKSLFDHDLHHAVKVEYTDEEGLDNCIKEVYRKGYRANHGLLRPADVAIWRYAPPGGNEVPEPLEPPLPEIPPDAAT